MCRTKGRSRGFTLIASLLVLALLSGIAISLLFMVQGAGQVGGNDLETNRAYYGAESGMELLTANLAALYQQSQSPTPAQLTALANNPPDSTMISSMNYQESITWTPDANGNPAAHTSVISSGTERRPYRGDHSAYPESSGHPAGWSVGEHDAGRGSGAHPGLPVRCFFRQRLELFRRPRFQLSGPGAHQRQSFSGRGQRQPLVLDDKVTAVGEIIRDRLANNFLTNANYTGRRLCAQAEPGLQRDRRHRDESCAESQLPEIHACRWPVGAVEFRPPALRPTSTTWTQHFHNGISTTFGGWIGNSTSMAVQPLTLPFVQGANGSAQQIQIIRKAPLGEAASIGDGIVARVQQSQCPHPAGQHSSRSCIPTGRAVGAGRHRFDRRRLCGITAR